jgi:ABC-type nickel/cobalt efflux system permease component RcnA
MACCVIRETRGYRELFGMHDFFVGRPRHDTVEAFQQYSHGHITCLHVHHLFGACTRAHAVDVLGR